MFIFFFSSRRRHTRLQGDWSSDVCSSDLSARYRVIHQRAGENLAVIAKEHLFAKRFAKTLSHAAVNLPVENHGVDNNAAVIDQDELFKSRHPGFPIDSHQRQMGAEAPGFTFRIKEDGLLKTKIRAARN